MDKHNMWEPDGADGLKESRSWLHENGKNMYRRVYCHQLVFCTSSNQLITIRKVWLKGAKMANGNPDHFPNFDFSFQAVSNRTRKKGDLQQQSPENGLPLDWILLMSYCHASISKIRGGLRPVVCVALWGFAPDGFQMA
jgi:hypothetical protein